jgi:hypothetical protein
VRLLGWCACGKGRAGAARLRLGTPTARRPYLGLVDWAKREAAWVNYWKGLYSIGLFAAPFRGFQGDV